MSKTRTPELIEHESDDKAVSLPAEQAMTEQKQNQAPINWMDGKPEQFKAALDNRSENRRILLDWIRDALKDGTDYGRVHFVSKKTCGLGVNCQDAAHFSKPSLWKAGAEKITGMLGLTAVWPDAKAELESVKAGAKIITMRCELVSPQGHVVSEGVGARSIEQDYSDINKALKMAKKSSMIDAVLNAAGLSEVFTQDIEDTSEVAIPLTDDGIDYLHGIARDLYGDKADATLAAMARRKFHIASGEWKAIPDHRLADAVKSLKEKATPAKKGAAK